MNSLFTIWNHRYVLAAQPILLAFLLAACSLTVPKELKQGLGQPCTVNEDCQASRCLKSTRYPDAGICANSCNNDADCPSGTECIKSSCQVPLAVGVALTGNQEGNEGWTVSHVAGLHEAAQELGYVRLDPRFGLTPGNILPDLMKLSIHNRLILGNTVDYLKDFETAAELYPDKIYAAVDDGVSLHGRSKVTTYWIHRVEAWYLAGQAAAHLAGPTHRLGVISAFVNPETVADVNAFTLGAQTVDPDIRVYVGHVGFWFDDNLNKKYTYTHTRSMVPVTDTYFREEYLAALLADRDCKVIAHLTNTQRSVAEIDRLVKAKLIPADTYSMANDKRQGCVDGTGAPIPSCFGSIYENWHSLYRDLFEEVHLGTFHPTKPRYYDIDDSPNPPTGVELNPGYVGDRSKFDSVSLTALQQSFARGAVEPRRRVFKGPFTINGQRDLDHDGLPDPQDQQQVKAGEFVEPAELARMCWYVDGVWEFIPPQKAGDQPTERKAIVPGGLNPGATTPNDLAVPPDKDAYVVPKGLSYQCILNSQ